MKNAHEELCGLARLLLNEWLHLREFCLQGADDCVRLVKLLGAHAERRALVLKLRPLLAKHGKVEINEVQV